MATLCHLGNIAMKVKRKIRWVPAAEQITGDVEAAAILSHRYEDLGISKPANTWKRVNPI